MPELRPANHNDIWLLYQWRRQDETKPWYDAEATTPEQHQHWFLTRRHDPLTHILIWQTDRGPAGVVRIDSNGEITFHSADPRQTTPMLQAALQYAAEYGGRLKATIDQADTERLNAYQAAGFQTYPGHTLTYTINEG